VEGRQIRETFLAFFEQRGHRRVASSSLIPPPDSGLLLTTAGMVQFIPYFLGLSEPPYPRATTAQKSFRTTDIDLVGHTARHLTFFEMLGNFSFGDYFKQEACAWAHELVTEGYGIDHDRLWVTVFESDEEAIDIWADEVGIPRERIVRRGRADNFWWTHAAGPGGPCSEIFVDRGPRYGPEGGPAVDEERFLEIWNLVFMQNQMDDRGEVVGELPKKNIDTGSSVERVAVVLQGVDSVFDTDLLRPLVAVGEELSGKRYGEDERTDVSLRIVAEHGRATTFLLADGVLPANEGRGYVLRRMLRRLVSHARRLGVERPVTERLAETTVDVLGDAYPELSQNRAFIVQVAGSEEERFAGTLRQGLALFEAGVAKVKAGGTLPGEVAFKLHDTHGFPLELTAELAADVGLSVDTERFAALMEEQRERAQRAAKKGKLAEEVAEVAARSGRSEFVGYEALAADGRVLALLADGGRAEVAEEGREIQLILDRTPFYAEAGGQIGDRGTVRTPGAVIRVTDTQWGPGDVIVHTARVESGEVREGEEAHAEVDADRRAATARSHTATHVVHWTLKHVLGEHARQAGSLVAPGRLRFDFPHHSPVPREVLEEAEEIANRRLAEDAPVRAFETTLGEARRLGAIALFGEKYGDFVRVVEVGDYSMELCGGTHVARTGNVALVRILHEASIGAGMRRIEALVGPDALREINVERELLEAVAEILGTDPRGAAERARQLVERVKRLETELGRQSKADLRRKAEAMKGAAEVIAGANVVVRPEDADADTLRELAQTVAGLLENGQGAAVVLGTGQGGKALLVAACSKNLVGRGVTAPRLLEEAAKVVGGGAGGKPTLGFAGGPKGEAYKQALDTIRPRVKRLLKERA